MAAKLKELMKGFEKFASPRLAESWDRVGLFLGEPDQEIKKVLLALGISDVVVEEAIDYEADLILTHHPLWLNPPVYLSEETPEGKRVAKLIRNRIAVYSAHTNLDACRGGVNDVIASRLGLKNIFSISPISEKWLKLAIYVPKSHWLEMRLLMGELGIGQLGDYSHCTFSTEGFGSFLPLEGATPAIGKVGKIEQVEEMKVEGIIKESDLERILPDLLEAHPYEEVAYDLIPLEGPTQSPLGIGKVGTLETEMTLEEFADYVKKTLDLEGVRIFGNRQNKIQTVALCGGSGMSLASDVVKTQADVFLTGDIKHHEAEAALENGLNLIDGGHYGTEKSILSVLAQKILAPYDVETKISEKERELFSFR